MNRNVLFKLAASGLGMVGGIVAPAVIVQANDSQVAPSDAGRASRAAERAQEALERGRNDRALRFAEEAVAFNPADADYRIMLGQAYLANGRFVSAEASFDAARTLGSTAPGAIIGHALSLIGTDRAADALTLIESHVATLPASDFGLALALAGQPERGALVLTDVVRAGDSTPRDRQNLALAYALAGRWLEARLIAGQDISPALLTQRMTQWASMSQASDPRQRIAGLIGTDITDDPGMPVQLALRGGAAAPQTLAMADDPAPLALYAPAPQQDSAALVDSLLDEPAPAPAAVVTVAIAPPTPAAAADANDVAIIFVSNPVIQPLRGMVAMVAPLAAPAAAAAASAEPAARPVASGPVKTSGWAVQLGAYDSVGVARDGWDRATRRHSAVLGGKDAVSTSAVVRGRTVYRLAVTGYDNRTQAQADCAAIARSGGACFVRQIASGEPVRWASRPVATRVAVR